MFKNATFLPFYFADNQLFSNSETLVNNTIPIDYIQLESHNDDMYLMDETKGQIPFLLKSNGFKKCTVIKHSFGDFNECIYEK